MKESAGSIELFTPEWNRKGEERLHIGDTDVTLIKVDEEDEQPEHEGGAKV
jgi:hypothetical protein